MTPRVLLALVLATLLALPARPQDFDLDLAQGLFVLRTGDAHAMHLALDYVRTLTPPATPPERWTLFVGPDALAPLVIAWTEGDWGAVLEQGRKAAAAAHTPERELAVRLLMLQAAEACGKVALKRELLTRVEELARQAPGARGQLDRFLAASFRASDDFDRTVPTREEVRARLRAAFGELQGLEGDEDYRRTALVEPILLPLATQFWLDRLVRDDLVDEVSPTIIKSIGGLYRGLESNPEAGLDLLGARIQMAAYYHEFMAYLAESLYRHEKVTFEEAEALLQHELDSGDHDYAGLAAAAQNINLLKLVLPGAIARYVSVPHQQTARVMMEHVGRDPKADSSKILGHLARATEVLSGSSSAQLHELELDQATALWLVRPEGWEKKLETALSQTTSPDRVRALMLRGQLRAFQGRKPEAIADLTRAVELLEGVLAESGQPALAAELRQRYSTEYTLLTRLQLESGQPEQAAETLDRQNQAAALTSVRLRDLEPARPELRQEVEQANRLRGQIATLSPQAATDPQAAALLAQTRGEFYATLNTLQAKEPAYGKLSVRPTNFSRLQKELPADTVLVQLFPADDRLYFFVATREGLKIRQVPVTGAHLGELIGSFRRQVVAYGRSATPLDWQSEPGQALAANLIELGDLLWAPLQDDLKGKRQVVFVPTGALDYLPLQALARPGKPRPRFLLEEQAVSVITKSSDLDCLGRAPAASGPAILALADPDGSLSGARREAAEVGALFPGSQVFVGSEATRDRLAALDPSVGYLHLATHGILDPATPTDTYLLVAGGTGQLSVTDIANLDLGPVRLVTLSACQSALADRNPSVGWELSSLADAFGFAGSPAMLASLWKVSDESTHTLMLAFYGALKSGAGRAEALRQAELSLLDNPATTHPFHWAAFELMGDWR